VPNDKTETPAHAALDIENQLGEYRMYPAPLESVLTPLTHLPPRPSLSLSVEFVTLTRLGADVMFSGVPDKEVDEILAELSLASTAQEASA
jgi:hypothetical protein